VTPRTHRERRAKRFASRRGSRTHHKIIMKMSVSQEAAQHSFVPDRNKRARDKCHWSASHSLFHWAIATVQ
jgi:hypothetical protein